MSAGLNLAVISPDGHGIRTFDAVNGAQGVDITLPGRNIVSLFATPDGHRFITIEHTATFSARRGGGGGPGRNGQGPPADRGNTAPQSPVSAGIGAAGGGASEAYEVNLWDPDDVSEPLASLGHWEREGLPPPLVAVSPDGRTVASGRFSKPTVTLWSTGTGLSLGQVEAPTGLTALALGSDNQLATAGGGEVHLWDADAKTPVAATLQPKQSWVRLLRFSPRGSLLAVVGSSGTDVELWDTAAHTVVSLLKPADRVDDLAFAPDGRTLAVAGPGKEVSVWAVVDSDIRTRFAGFDGMARTLAFRDDGLLPLGTVQGSLRFWDAGRWLHARPETASALSVNPAVSPTWSGPQADGTRIRPPSMAFDDRGRLLTLDSDALRVWDAPPSCPKNLTVPIPKVSNQMAAGATLLAVAVNGRSAAIGRGEHVLLWHSDDPERLEPLGLPDDLISRARERERERDRDRRRPPRNGGPGAGILFWSAMTVGPAGDRIYLVDNSGFLHAWAVDAGKAVELKWGNRLTTVAPRSFTPSQTPPQGPPGFGPGVMSLALSPDGTTLAVGDRAGGVTLVDTRTGGITRTLRQAPGQSDGGIFSLAFAPGNKELAVGTQQGRIELWAVVASAASPADAPLLTLPGHRGFVLSLCFDPRNHHLASAGSDRTIDVWDLRRFRDEFQKLGLSW